MKEKKKGKIILFASFLRPTEELLWQSPERVTLRSVMPKFSLSSIGLLIFVIAAIVIIDRLARESSGFGTFIILIVLPALIWVSFIAIYVNGWIGQFFKIKFPDARYAITSERLFYQRREDIQAEALENIPLIDVLPDNTLSFGAAFPQWSGLEDAEDVKSIIERAQKERSKGQSATLMAETTLTSTSGTPLQQIDLENIERGQKHHLKEDHS
jgi:hypothetical protein